ncbi:hypothetical protein [Ureibacillus thermosphaericus]|uniref:hypothetical protein n=1 Tax=Ureibacillus thermosphaericus TaxID=51173 RepID=UPI0030C91395
MIGYGANGVVLKPLKNEFATYCIKTVYNDFLKENILKINREEKRVSKIYLEYLNDNLGIKENLKEEIENYRKISSIPSLKKYIPKLYYPIDNETENKFMVLEFINGISINIEGLYEIKDEKLLSIIEEFTKQGFEFGDKIEAIKKDDGSIIIIDLDSIQKNK